MQKATGLIRYMLSAAALAALAACGGGGGGDAGNPGASDPLAITADNANSVARAGLQAAGSLAAIGDIGASLGLLTGQQATISQVRRAHAMAVTALGAQRKALGSRTDPCAGGGSLTLSFNDSNADNQLNRAGESVSLTASNCSDGAGGTSNGSFTLQLTSFTDATHLAFTLSFASFRSSDASTGTAASIEGSVSASLDGLARVTVTSPSLSLSATGGGVTRSFGAQAVSMGYVDDGSAVTESLAGTFTSSDFPGQSVQISTLVPLVILWTDTYPSQGMLQVTGANHSSIKIEALNATQAQIYIDANGDGGFETTKVVNWSDLD